MKEIRIFHGDIELKHNGKESGNGKKQTVTVI